MLKSLHTLNRLQMDAVERFCEGVKIIYTLEPRLHVGVGKDQLIFDCYQNIFFADTVQRCMLYAVNFTHETDTRH
jgi:hypothetical protein